jgi:serine protease
MSFRFIALVVATSLWLLVVSRDGTGLSAQARGTGAPRGPLLSSSAGEGNAAPLQPQEEPSSSLLTAERLQALALATQEHLNWVPGEVLVKFKPGVSQAQGSRALSALRGRPDMRTGRWIDDVLLVPTPEEDNPERAAGILAQQPEVLWAQPNYLRRLHALPNDPGYGSQWNLDEIGLPAAWEINAGGNTDLLVAVVDSGVTEVTRTYFYVLWTGRGFEIVPVPYAMNPDISQDRFASGHDFVPAFSGLPVLDTEGHGTHVAGTILQSTNNDFGFAGVAYNARLLPVKVCYSAWDFQFAWSASGRPGKVEVSDCPDDAIADGLRWAADQGARIINLSIGGPGKTPVVLEALQYAVGKGAFVAVSAGNNFDQSQWPGLAPNVPLYPASYGHQIEGVMTVGAVGRSMKHAYYSNTSSGTEIAAPGGDYRDGGTSGLIYQVGLYGPDYDFDAVVRPRFDRYVGVPQQGTSMAAPHVAGVAALLYSQGVKNPAAIEAAIKRFARDLGTPGVDSEYGAGLVDARATLRGLGVAR